MDIFLLIFFCVNIALRAKMRGLKAAQWVLSTIVAVIVGVVVSMSILLAIMKSRPEYRALSQLQFTEMVQRQEIKFSSWNLMFMYVGAFGGYLFIRYLVDKRPKLKNKPEDDQIS